MENDTFARLYLRHFISPYKENTTTVSIRLISTAIAEKQVEKLLKIFDFIILK